MVYEQAACDSLYEKIIESFCDYQIPNGSKLSSPKEVIVYAKKMDVGFMLA